MDPKEFSKKTQNDLEKTFLTLFDEMHQPVEKVNNNDKVQQTSTVTSENKSFHPSRENLLQIAKNKILGEMEDPPDNEELKEEVTAIIDEEITRFSSNHNSHPFQEEEDLINTVGSYSTQRFFDRDVTDQILQYLSTEYSTSEINTRFFRATINELYQKTNRLVSLKNIKKELIDRWTILFQQKIDAWALEQLENYRQKLLEKIADKLNEYTEIQSDVESDEKGVLWNSAKGNWKKADIDLLENYIKLIEEYPGILRIAKLLGRRSTDGREAINSVKRSTPRAKDDTTPQIGREELVGIHESNDLQYLVPSELGLLGDNYTETLFYVKLIRSKLMSFNLIGKTPDKVEFKDDDVTKSTSTEQNNGPIVICIDTSGSMQGVPEKIAKILALAIIRIASEKKRKCYLISFSTGTRSQEFSGIEEDLTKILEFLKHSFSGGTSFTSPIKKAIALIEHGEYTDADVLMISDFVMGSPDNQLSQAIRRVQNQGTKFHSLIISSSYNHRVMEYFTHNWVFEIGAQPPIREL